VSNDWPHEQVFTAFGADGGPEPALLPVDRLAESVEGVHDRLARGD